VISIAYFAVFIYTFNCLFNPGIYELDFKYIFTAKKKKTSVTELELFKAAVYYSKDEMRDVKHRPWRSTKCYLQDVCIAFTSLPALHDITGSILRIQGIKQLL